LILVAAAIIAALLGDAKNAIAIGAMVLLYALLGFVQDYRADQASVHVGVAHVDIGTFLIQRDSEALLTELRSPECSLARRHAVNELRLVPCHSTPDDGVAGSDEENERCPLGRKRADLVFRGCSRGLETRQRCA
jgi:hypothetical protein